MHGGKSVKGLAPQAKAFWGWLQGKGWVDDFASISGLLINKEFPIPGTVQIRFTRGLESFFDLFGEEGEQNSPETSVPFHFNAHGKGVKGLAPRAQAFWGWLQGKGWEADFASISGLLNQQGIPDTGNSADLVARELENFFDLFGEGKSKIPRKHLSRFTSMQSVARECHLPTRFWLFGHGLIKTVSCSGRPHGYSTRRITQPAHTQLIAGLAETGHIMGR